MQQTDWPSSHYQRVSFFVPGVPAPGGSKRGLVNRKTGRVVIVDDAKRNKDWRAVVALVASQVYHRCSLGPVAVDVAFVVPRPKSHLRANGKLKPTAPAFPTTKPDATKLWRSTEDALTGIAWADDAQVIEQRITKRYGDRPGAWIVISEIRKEQAA